MADVMNTWINDSSGSWGSAETIKYDSSNLINIKLDLYSAVFQLEEVKLNRNYGIIRSSMAR